MAQAQVAGSGGTPSPAVGPADYGTPTVDLTQLDQSGGVYAGPEGVAELRALHLQQQQQPPHGHGHHLPHLTAHPHPHSGHPHSHPHPHPHSHPHHHPYERMNLLDQ